jgi:autoinducer 2-degrading protein
MLIAHIQVHVKPEFIEAFKQATIENASNSIKEPGIARFDILQQNDAPERFVFIEVYRSPDAALKHKETPHYAIWRDTVANMMAEPRIRAEYSYVFPADE